MVGSSMPRDTRSEEGSVSIDVAGQKRLAGEAALDEVSSGMRLGLGTGSTVRYFLEALARRLTGSELVDVSGVPTSRETSELCRSLGIPELELDEMDDLDLAVDGADEVTPALDLIKGLGGALLREKIVVQAARRFVVIVDSGKEVRQLGEHSPLPVEVVPFGWRRQLPFLRSLGCEAVPRTSGAGELFVSDNGNYLIDLHFSSPLDDPAEMEQALRARAGVVATGFFLDMADLALVGTKEGGVRRLRAEDGAESSA